LADFATSAIDLAGENYYLPHSHISTNKRRAAAGKMKYEYKFRCCTRGLIGAGIYFARSNSWASNRKAQQHGPILQCVINLGRVKYLSAKAHILEMVKLNSEGYDSAWLVRAPQS
jgi:hypothetical protein